MTDMAGISAAFASTAQRRDEDEALAELARRLIELTRDGNEAAAMSLLRQAAGVDD